MSSRVESLLSEKEKTNREARIHLSSLRIPRLPTVLVSLNMPLHLQFLFSLHLSHLRQSDGLHDVPSLAIIGVRFLFKWRVSLPGLKFVFKIN